MESTLALLIPLAGIAMVFGIVYLGVTSDNRKNLAMIEAGMNPNEKSGDKRKNLRNGLLLIFIPVGLFIGNYIVGNDFSRIFSKAGIASAFLFGGIALLLFYFIDVQLDKKEQNQ